MPWSDFIRSSALSSSRHMYCAYIYIDTCNIYVLIVWLIGDLTHEKRTVMPYTLVYWFCCHLDFNTLLLATRMGWHIVYPPNNYYVAKTSWSRRHETSTYSTNIILAAKATWDTSHDGSHPLSALNASVMSYSYGNVASY
jgi:hypothetical protein